MDALEDMCERGAGVALILRKPSNYEADCQLPPTMSGSSQPSFSTPATSSSGPPIVKSWCTLGQAPTEPHVGGDILVEEAMQERQLELGESVVRRNERDLANHGGAVVGTQHLPKPRFTLACRGPHESSLLEAQGDAGHIGAQVGEWTRHRDQPVGAPEIWCGTGFFWWNVRQVRLAPSVFP